MGEKGRKELSKLYDKTDRKKLDFQTFYPILGTPSFYYFDKEQVLQNMFFRDFKIISKENYLKL